MQRRKFIKKTSLLSMGLGITNNALSNVQKQKVNLNRDALPVVIATWDVKNATKKAWETIKPGWTPFKYSKYVRFV